MAALSRRDSGIEKRVQNSFWNWRQHGAGGDRRRIRSARPLRNQLGGDQAGLQRLAEADVVGEQEPHPVLGQRHFDGRVLEGEVVDRGPAERQGLRSSSSAWT